MFKASLVDKAKALSLISEKEMEKVSIESLVKKINTYFKENPPDTNLPNKFREIVELPVEVNSDGMLLPSKESIELQTKGLLVGYGESGTIKNGDFKRWALVR